MIHHEPKEQMRFSPASRCIIFLPICGKLKAIMGPIRIAQAQINPTVGDFRGTWRKSANGLCVPGPLEQIL